MKLFVVVILVTILTGCGGGSESATSSYANINEGSSDTSTSTSAAKAVHQGQVKDSSTGNGLADVTVTIGESTTTTDVDGFYALSDLTENEEIVVNFKKEGYVLVSTHIQIKGLSGDDTTSSNFLVYNMYVHGREWTYESQNGATDGAYRGEISHPGTWSLSQAIEEEVGIYRGHILNSDGSPISDVRLYAVGENWISTDLSTDENGLFEIEVIPGNSFQLAAYNYKDKYGAIYNGIIPAIASGEIVEN